MKKLVLLPAVAALGLAAAACSKNASEGPATGNDTALSNADFGTDGGVTNFEAGNVADTGAETIANDEGPAADNASTTNSL